MTIRAVLADLVDGLESQSDTLLPFLDEETGEVILMEEYTLSKGDADLSELDDLQGWQKVEALLAHAIVTTDRYHRLPTRFDVNEYVIMQDFCDEVVSDKARAELQNAMHGQRAFRRFKDALLTLNLADAWFAYRRKAFEEVLRPWCEEHGVILVPKLDDVVEQGSLNF